MLDVEAMSGWPDSSSRRRRLAVTAAVGLMVIAATGCRTGSSGARSGTTSVINLFTPPSPTQAAVWAQDEWDADKRQRGLLLLANAPFGGEQVYLDFYRLALDDDDAGVRIAALRALGMHGEPEDVPAIVEQLQQEDHLVRWEAAKALQRIHNPEAAVPSLMTTIREDEEQNVDVRAAATIALGQYPERRVLDALVGALSDPSLMVNRDAARSLRMLTGEEFGLDDLAWVAWLRETNDPFAGIGEYRYPIFERDRRFAEWFVPWFEPPNEVLGPPAGMPARTEADSTERDDETIRNN
jgi:hypothetical protein